MSKAPIEIAANAPRARRLRATGMGAFLRAYGTVAVGNAGGQVAVALSAPILSRIYTPENYGISGVVVSIATVALVVATLRYDSVILSGRSRSARANAAALAMLLILGFSAILAAALGALVAMRDVDLAQRVLTDPIILLAPLLVVVTGVDSSLLENFLVVSRNYRRLATAGFARGTGAAAGQIALGLLGLGPLGIILGRLVGHLLAIAMMAAAVGADGARALAREVRRRRMRRVATAHYRQAVFMAPANALNVVASQIPVFLLTPLFGAASAGAYYFINAIAMSGLWFFMSNASGLILREATVRRQRGQAVFPFIATLVLLVAAPAFGVATLMAFFGVPFVTFIFGDQWALSGQIFTYTAFYYAAIPTFIPASATAQLFRNQHINMLTQLCRVIGAVSAILYGASQNDFMLSIMLLAASDVGIYLIATGVVLARIRRSDRERLGRPPS